MLTRARAAFLVASLLISACSSATQPPATSTPTPTQTPTFQVVALPTRTPTRTQTLTVTPPGEIQPPGQPGVALNGALDPLATTARPLGAAFMGDAYANNLFERPFTASGGQPLPDVDLASVHLSQDERWFYFSIKVAGLRQPNRQLLADYAIEFDLDLDGRGDRLLWTTIPLSQAWATGGTRIYADQNDDVGGTRPLLADQDRPGNGYETLLFDGAQAPGLETAWSRLDPLDPLGVQLAVERQALDQPARMLWSAWADAKLRQPGQFDYNDAYPSNADALQAIDSTCRAAYGFEPAGNEPGVCPPEWRAATPEPTEAPTETLQFSLTPTTSGTPTRTGTPGSTGTITPTGSTTPGPSPTLTFTPTVTQTLAPGSPSVISGTVWLDSNSDSVRDADEPGLAGFTLRLGNSACPSSGLATQISTTNGSFSFSGLNPGSYCLSIDHPDRANTNPDQVTVDLSDAEHQNFLFGIGP